MIIIDVLKGEMFKAVTCDQSVMLKDKKVIRIDHRHIPLRLSRIY